MNETTTHLQLPILAAAQAQKHVTHNEALALIDLVVQLCVVSNSISAPPDAPEEGARYIVPVGAVGDFTGHDGEIAAFDGGAWRYLKPVEAGLPGCRALVRCRFFLVVVGAGCLPLQGSALIAALAVPRFSRKPRCFVKVRTRRRASL